MQEDYSSAEFQAACREYIKTVGPLKVFSKYQPPPNVVWDDEKYQGDAYGTYAWAVYVAEITYDTLTFEVHVDDFVALQEVGKVINPILAVGQPIWSLPFQKWDGWGGCDGGASPTSPPR